MEAKEMTMNFFGHYHNVDDDIRAVLKEKIWHVILNIDDLSKKEVMIDAINGKIVCYVSLDQAST